MKIKKSIVRLIVCTIVFGFVTSAYAVNRNDVFNELEKINTSWEDVSIDVWINDFENDAEPGVLVGDELIYRVKSDKPAFFAFILVDARGNMAVLKPDALSSSGINGASQSITFPTEEQSQSGESTIKQAAPLGKESVFVLASDQHIPADVFGLDPLSDYVNYRTDLGESRALVERLNAHSDDTKMALVRYEYFVDSDTQFSTRGIRREISDRIEEVSVTVEPVKIVEAEMVGAEVDKKLVSEQLVQEPEPLVKSSPIVINDINFDHNSDVLTDRGINQLEILGSELIDLQSQNQLPKVRLTGHTDSSGSADYNMDLSKRRSMASKRFLVDELGLPEEFIDTHGMGETVAIEDNSTGAGRARNRRVEFEIIK